MALDHPLYSVGLYGCKYVLLLKEFNKCVVVWEKPKVGIMIGDLFYYPATLVFNGSALRYIYKDGSEYVMGFKICGYQRDFIWDTMWYDTIRTDGVIGRDRGDKFRLMTPREAFLCHG